MTAKGETNVGPQLGLRLLLIRRRAGLDQKRFGRIMGVSQRTVSSMERGHRLPRADEMLRVCKALNLSMDEFKTASV